MLLAAGKEPVAILRRLGRRSYETHSAFLLNLTAKRSMPRHWKPNSLWRVQRIQGSPQVHSHLRDEVVRPHCLHRMLHGFPER